MAKLTILPQSCKGVDDCGICKFVCPQQLFQACREMNAAGYYPPELTDPDECTGCRTCMLCCPDFAIIVEKGEKLTDHNSEDPHGSEP